MDRKFQISKIGFLLSAVYLIIVLYFAFFGGDLNLGSNLILLAMPFFIFAIAFFIANTSPFYIDITIASIFFVSIVINTLVLYSLGVIIEKKLLRTSK